MKLDDALNILYENSRTEKIKEDVRELCQELESQNFSRDELLALKRQVEIMDKDNNQSLTLLISYMALVVSALTYITDFVSDLGGAPACGTKLLIFVLLVIYFCFTIKPQLKSSREITKSRNALLAIECMLDKIDQDEKIQKE